MDFILLWHKITLNIPKTVELKNTKYQFRVENTEFKIPNLRHIGLFSRSIVFKTEGLQNVVVSVWD